MSSVFLEVLTLGASVFTVLVCIATLAMVVIFFLGFRQYVSQNRRVHMECTCTAPTAVRKVSQLEMGPTTVEEGKKDAFSRAEKEMEGKRNKENIKKELELSSTSDQNGDSLISESMEKVSELVKNSDVKTVQNSASSDVLSSQLLTPALFSSLLPLVDTFIFDADGVLWLGEKVIPGSPRLLDFLISQGKTVIVLTNNATKSRAVYAKKLSSLGFHPSIDKNSLVNPAAVAADLLKEKGLAENGKKIYLIGSKGMRDEMDEVGIRYFGHGMEPVDDTDGSQFLLDIILEEPKEEVGAVLVGYEKHFNYHKLMKAANYLSNNECLFVATNEDETCPGPNPGVIIPDSGPIVAALRCASGREPIVVGKPNSPAFDFICKRWKIEAKRTMMIGDRTNTDVLFGNRHGLRTLLVLSGCHGLEDVMENQKKGRMDMVPEFYAPSLGSLIPET